MPQHQSPRLNALLFGLLAVTILTGLVWGVCRPSQHGLQGTYYANTDWKGQPFLTVIDSTPSNRVFETHRAQIGQQPFSVEWTGYLKIPESGVYTLTTASDDGSYLLIDDLLVVDNGGPHGLQERHGTLMLRQGFHRFAVRYFDLGGSAALRVFWQRGNGERTLIPSQNLIPPISVTRVWMVLRLRVVWLALAGLWGLAGLFALAASFWAFRRRTDSRRAAAASYPGRMLRTVAAAAAARLFVLPAAWAMRQLVRPAVRYWFLIVFYTAAIFLTLSYARTWSTLLTDRYGDEVFSTLTRVALIAVGLAMLLYVVRLRDRLWSRLIVFAGVGAVYAYVLSPALRAAVHDLHPACAAIGAYLEALEIFPIVAVEKIHFLEYGLLGVLLCKALSFHVKDKLAYPLAVLGVYIVGLLDEGIQWALPNRVGEYRDIGINLLAGILAVTVVGLVMRPRAFEKYARWSSLRPLGYALALALALTGVFLQYAHGFGQSITLPDSLVEFVSVFSEQQLLTLDQVRRQRLEHRIVADITPLDAKNFDYEGSAHRYFRDWYFQRRMFWESYGEQEILKICYGSYLQQHRIALLEYDPAQLAIPSDHAPASVYRSAAQQLAITAFSAATMWTFISISAALAVLMAGFCPYPVRRPRNFLANLPLRRRWFEPWIMRPILIVLLVAVIVRAILLNAETPPAPTRSPYQTGKSAEDHVR